MSRGGCAGRPESPFKTLAEPETLKQGNSSAVQTKLHGRGRPSAGPWGVGGREHQGRGCWTVEGEGRRAGQARKGQLLQTGPALWPVAGSLLR